MTEAVPECYAEPCTEDEVQRVLDYLDERREDGASAITIASIAGCNIPLSHAVDILDRLEGEHKARRVMKGRLELWFPPLSSYDKSIEQVEDSKIHEVREPPVPGGRIPCPVKGCESRVGKSSGSWPTSLRGHLSNVHHLSDDVIDKAIADLRDNKAVEIEAPDKSKITCRHCGKEHKNYGVTMHERWCQANPERGKNIYEARKKKYGDRAIKPGEPLPGSGPSAGKCQYCGRVCESRLRNHERLCAKNPGRFIAKGKPKEPTPIDDGVPPGGELMGPDKGHNDALGAYELSKPPTCATCADDQCGDRGKDLIACDDHEPGLHFDGAEQHIDLEQEIAERDLAAMPECESGTCTIGPPRDRIPYPYPESDREPVAVVQDLTTKYGRCTSTTMPPENWSAAKMDVTTSAGEHLTTQTFIPESKWRANDAKEDVEAWLHRELDALVRGAKERGLQASATVEWGTGGLRGDLVVRRGVRA